MGYDFINSCKKQHFVDFKLTIYYLADSFRKIVVWCTK